MLWRDRTGGCGRRFFLWEGNEHGVTRACDSDHRLGLGYGHTLNYAVL